MPFVVSNSLSPSPRLSLPFSAKAGRKTLVRPLNYKSQEAEQQPQSTTTVDYYQLLNVSRTAEVQEIKQKYRQLQKQYHPDNTKNGEQDMSVLLNKAYIVLTDSEQRRKYDSQQIRKKKVVRVRELRREEGLIKTVLPDAKLTTIQVESTQYALEDIKLWIREWCTTMAFGCDLPLPIPVQADPLPEGARLSFMIVQQDSLSSVGELIFKINPQNSSPMTVEIWRRVWMKDAQNEIPGEKIIIKNFSKAFKKCFCVNEGSLQDRFQLGGFPAAVMAGMMHILPVFGEDGDAGYEAYHLKPLKKEQTVN